MDIPLIASIHICWWLQSTGLFIPGHFSCVMMYWTTVLNKARGEITLMKAKWHCNGT
jgi:hypothetical protein